MGNNRQRSIHSISTREQSKGKQVHTDEIKILLIGPLPPPVGGTTASFAHLIEKLSLIPELRASVIPTFATTKRTIRSHLLAPLRTIFTLCQAIPRHDVVTFHASTRRLVYFGPLLLALCRLFRRPLILRGFGGSLDLAYVRGSQLQRLMIRSLFYADAVLVQTKKLRDFFQPLYPWANLVWFPNSRPRSGEDMRATIKPNNQRHSHEKRFVYLGVVKPSKGIREILSVAKSLNDVPFTVDVYGPLEEGLTQDEFEGQTKVVYRGVVDNKEAISLLASYDALLLPSYYEGEGHPGVILEAYMAGIPVITTRWRTIPEIVEDGISGILIEPRDINSLGRAIRRLIEDPDYMNALKMGASKHGEKFTSEYWIQDVFVKLCRSVVKKQQPDLESEVAHESP